MTTQVEVDGDVINSAWQEKTITSVEKTLILSHGALGKSLTQKEIC